MKRLLSVASVAIMCVVAAACSSGPTDPSSASGVQAGATIQGTVNPSASTAGDRAHALSASAGIKVTVMGTGLSATTNGQGQFVLKGVPTGSVTLHFEGPGIDATLTLSGLADGQTLTITVHVAGSHALEEPEPSPSPGASPSPAPSPTPEPSPSPKHSPEPGEETDFHGTIDSITLPTLVVSGKNILTDSHTKVEGNGGGDGEGTDSELTLKDLKVGDKVEGQGIRQSNGDILAREIQVTSGGEGGDSKKHVSH